MEKSLTVILTVTFGLVMFAAVAGMLKAAEPVPQYSCPICGDPFFTYEDLYNHFVTEHPAEPIDIIWE